MKSEGPDMVRMELKYCESCGALWLRSFGSAQIYCGPCRLQVAQLPPEKKRSHPQLPTPLRDEMDDGEFEFWNDDTLDAESAGGVA